MSKGVETIRKPPARSPARREQQLISLAVDLAEQRLRDGTASSQLVTHYLKLATQREKLELESLRAENRLKAAKAEAIQSQKRSEEIFLNALDAMKRYTGTKSEEFYEDD